MAITISDEFKAGTAKGILANAKEIEYNPSETGTSAVTTVTVAINNLKKEVVENGSAFDITKYNNNTTYSGLTQAISGNNVPVNERSGGMSVKFVNSTTNKYEQWRYVGTVITGTSFTTLSNWMMGSGGDGVFDISGYSNPATPVKYANLQAALGTDGANVPSNLRTGGMTVKFINSSTNKYEEWRYMINSVTNADFTTLTNWQGIDDKPMKDSQNLVKSGSVYDAYINQVYLTGGDTSAPEPVGFIASADTVWNKGEQIIPASAQTQVRENLGFGDGNIDAKPTSGSTNVVTSGGIFQELQTIEANTQSMISSGLTEIEELLDNAAVRYDQSQSLTSEEKAQALSNIGISGIDDEPTVGSDNLVRSGGVAEELALGSVYDVSAHNSGTTFASLSALLSDENLNSLIPTSVRKGGMSIKFVQSSDNKYVQYRYMGTSTTNADFVKTEDWQGVDEVPTAGSSNLVKSGGVYESALKTLSYSGLPDETIENGNVWRGNVGDNISTTTSSSSNFRVMNAIPVTQNTIIKVKTKLTNSAGARFILTDSNGIVTRNFGVTYDNQETTLTVSGNESYLYINGNDLSTLLLEVTTEKDNAVNERIRITDDNSIIRDAKLGVLELDEFANDGTSIEFNVNLGDTIVVKFDGASRAISFLDEDGNLVKDLLSPSGVQTYETTWVNVIKRITSCKAKYSILRNLKIKVLRYEAKAKDDSIEGNVNALNTNVSNLSTAIEGLASTVSALSTSVKNVKEEQEIYGAESEADNTEPLALSESDFESGNLQGGTGIEVSSTIVIRTKEYLRVVSGCTIETFTDNSYRNEIFEFDKDKNYLANTNWKVGTSQLTLRSDTEYVRLLVASPSGSDYAPVWEDAGYYAIPSKIYIKVKAASKDDIDREFGDYFSIESPIFAPSPQLPANDSDDSDFNIETVTSSDIYAAYDSLIDSLTAPNSGTKPTTPKILTKYNVSAMDESGTYPIHTYTFGLRNRYAWRHSDELYAWKNGSTIVYIDSCSPKVGAVIYSDANRTTSGKTVVSYNSATGTMIDSSSVSYTRDVNSNVSAIMVWSAYLPNEGSQNTFAVFNKNGAGIGFATPNSATQISFNSRTYERAECFDYHTDSKYTLFIWANEHGPTSDPLEPAVILYRMIRDLCGGCRNNQFLMFLKTYCKIVFIPCANPYGAQYPRVVGRQNYNHVNINRNYDTIGWGVASDTDRGAYAGSESETQYIMNMVKRFNPDIAIDIHCLGYVNPIAQGVMYFSETSIPEQNTYNRMVKTLSGLGFLFDQRGDPHPESAAHASEWLYTNNIVGGVFEMNAGDYVLEYNGRQHTAAIMDACYTEMLNCIRCWLAQLDPTLDLSKMCVR